MIALTDVEAEQLRAWFGASCPPLMILGNPTPLLDGRDHMSLLDEDGGPPELLWLARLHPRKRVSVFGQAARTAKREGLNWDFCVVGPDGGELPLLLEMVSELSRSPGPGRLRYEGAIPGAEVAQRVSKCQVFVLTADSEPWGNVLVLAISLGKPCVVPESSALATVVREFGAGIVVPDDEPNAVVRAVSEILSEHRYGSFVDGCRELAARHFSDAYQRQRLDALYRSFSPRA
ncbi:glycosyltransferase involved in cell wall biosynthesis [Nocardioides salarius]|uniref:Glycosyltransferase involved in cell wall biosynthesis n=1 Tax=Nocardioides salarius TaxID=374513 RepID=A0ABS2M930_9ACTN|nr:glycosyltransferase involved in cell wall biosynthesis [Nocardioides salarius]